MRSQVTREPGRFYIPRPPLPANETAFSPHKAAPLGQSNPFKCTPECA